MKNKAKIEKVVRNGKKTLKNVFVDVFYPYKETLEGLRDIWIQVVRKKESKLKVPELKTIPVISSKEDPEGLIEAMSKDFGGYPLTGNDLKKISYSMTEINKECPSYSDIILDNENYTMLFGRYPRKKDNNYIKERFEVLVAYKGKAVFISQFEENNEDTQKATEKIYETLLRNSLQFQASVSNTGKVKS